jgi:predicted dehydrogenase
MRRRRNSVRVGVVGAGKRAASYFTHIPDHLKPVVRLTALVDPSEVNRATFASLFGAGASVQHYLDTAEMLSETELDAVIVAPPNLHHAHDAELVLARGIPLLLEKPVAITVEECRRLWQASRAASAAASIAVGFVLRYTPFYSKVKEIVAAGTLGTILTIEADENLGTNLTNLFHRGWRRDNRLSGGFMVEKCCHDFDILNWLVGEHVEAVFSRARRTHFVANPRGGRHSRFAVQNIQRAEEVDFGNRRITEAFYTPIPGSPYDFPADSPDHQAVLLAFDRGALGTFTASMGQPRTTRGIRIRGTDGSLDGSLDDNRIVVYKPNAHGNDWEATMYTVEAEAGNHHGGDAVIAEAFWRTAAGESGAVKAGLREGIEAVLIALAAQESSVTRQEVNVRALRQKVFENDL